MIIWTVANQKGGVGKTTTIITIAGLLAERGYRVLMLDTDPHASLTAYLGFDADGLQGSLYELFQCAELTNKAIHSNIQKTAFDNLDLIPASMALATLDRVLGQKEGMGLVMKRILAKVEQDYDFALIDCPPVLGVMMVNALAASKRILVPVQTEFLAIKGLERMIKTFDIMQRSCPKPIKYSIVPTMYDKRTKASLVALQELKQRFPDNIWPSVVPIDTKFRDASLKHVPPSVISRGTRGVFAYSTLVNYLLQMDK